MVPGLRTGARWSLMAPKHLLLQTLLETPQVSTSVVVFDVVLFLGPRAGADLSPISKERGFLARMLLVSCVRGSFWKPFRVHLSDTWWEPRGGDLTLPQETQTGHETVQTLGLSLISGCAPSLPGLS